MHSIGRLLSVNSYEAFGFLTTSTFSERRLRPKSTVSIAPRMDVQSAFQDIAAVACSWNRVAQFFGRPVDVVAELRLSGEATLGA